jgi:hypothetical protein
VITMENDTGAEPRGAVTQDMRHRPDSRCAIQLESSHPASPCSNFSPV